MVEVIHYEKANKNKTVGYVDLRIPILKPTVLILRRLPHTCSGDKQWFNLASFSRQNADGTQTYLKFAEFENQIFNSHMMEGLHAKVEAYCKTHPVKEVERMDFGSFPEISNELPF